jgi:GTP-binding protein
MSHFTVAIVGRPNVGKSTLYNRLLGYKKAIVDDQSGVTRDRQYGVCEWNGRSFNLIDTGGFVPRSDDVFEAAIREQVQIAMDESQVVLFMVDVTTGLTDLDEEMLALLRRSPKKVIAVVNKVDNHSRLLEASEFYSMGLESLHFLSSLSGSGTGELLDEIVSFLPPEDQVEDLSALPRFAIIGQPNVGKSTLVNALLGQQRNIVTPIAGTTRDSIHTRYQLFGKDFLLIDTAGLRKKAKVHENLEFYSVIRAIKAIDEADVCILVLDATVGMESQDVTIFSLTERKRKGLLILVNKWDAVEKDANTHLDYQNRIRDKIAPFTDVPIIFGSALEKQRIFQAMEEALQIAERRKTRISTSKLNDWLQEVTERHHPPSVRGRHIRIKYMTQLPGHTPSFALFANHPDDVADSYRNYLENQLRKAFPLSGVPIRLHFRQK